MCDTPKCERSSKYWVQTRREITIPAIPEFDIPERKTILSQNACTRHLARAVRELTLVNRKAGQYVDNRDGVIVKTNVNGVWV